MKILVTGAHGFVGSALMRRLAADGLHQAVASTQRLASTTDWRNDLAAMDAVVHCAARVHVMRDSASDPLAQYRAVNVEGTLQLARQAAEAGIKRFIFISSIKVNGEATAPGKPFTDSDIPHPEDAYGLSKHEAEAGLGEIAQRTGMEVVMIRPPLVYGPGVKGNFASLMKLATCGIPLPLGSIKNQRSFVALENLVDLVALCLIHPAAANQTFLVSDDADCSTPHVIRAMAQAMGKPARLIAFPPSGLKLAAKIIGKPAIAERLCDSLQVDISATKSKLNWRPVLSMQAQLARMVAKPS